MCIREDLNNPSFAAFIGAVSAFTLVVINDLRRDRKKVRIIRNEIKIAEDHAINKLEAFRRNLIKLKEQDKINPSPILKFSPSIIRQLTIQVLDKFSQEERQSLDAICYSMESIDALIELSTKRVEDFENLKDEDIPQLRNSLKTEYEDTIINLKRLIEMCNNYNNKKYRTILTKQYVRSEYE
jgi:hypothetical protein